MKIWIQGQKKLLAWNADLAFMGINIDQLVCQRVMGIGLDKIISSAEEPKDVLAIFNFVEIKYPVRPGV